MLEIPFKGFPAFIEEIYLDNVPYKFLFMWNTRGEFWSLTVSNRFNVTLVAGIKLVLDQDLFAQYTDKGLPKGKLFVIDTSGSYAPIGRYDFENERKLKVIYIEENEVL